MTARVLIAAGGTGGHVFPALAVADELRRRGGEVMWLASGGMEMRLVPPRGIPLYLAPFAPPRGLTGAFRLLRAVSMARAVMRKLRPAAVLGMGGYAAAPGGLAARLCGVPLVVHEQNAAAGKANRLLHRFARQTLLGFPDALPGGKWVGNPARPEFFSGASSRRPAGAKPAILVLGGSQGASELNGGVPEALALSGREFSVTHQCGRGRLKETEEAYRRAGVAAEIAEFMDDVPDRMRSADLAVCRAGAATLAEVAAAGRASYLAPYRHAAADHQRRNARFFTSRGAAFGGDFFRPSALAEFLASMDGPMLEEAAGRARDLAKPEAAADAAAACLQEAGHAA